MAADVPRGIYPDLSDKEYHAGDGLSSTLLKQADKSMAHYQYAMANGIKDKPAYAFGRLVHTMVLEPHKLTTQYLAIEASTRTTKAYKTAVEQHPDKICVLSKEWDKAVDIAMQVCDDEHAKALMAGAQFEVTGFWQQEDTLCKFRADIWNRADRYMADLKTCASAEPEAFARDAYKYGYHISAAWYMHGAEMNSERVNNFYWIAVEKEPPYVVQVYKSTAQLIAAGRIQGIKAFDKIKRSTKSQIWPGYASEILPLDAPAWAQSYPELQLKQEGTE